jgi:hypothetical protein
MDLIHNDIINSHKIIIVDTSLKTKKSSKKSSKNPIITDETSQTGQTVQLEKEKSKRVITNTKQWNFLETDLDPMNQLVIVKQIMDMTKEIEPECSISETIDSFDRHLHHKIYFIRQQINNKIYGYKNQDLLKSKYDESKFVDLAKILEMMLANDLKCYYCNNPVLVLYEYVREPRQWTVERIDNKFGHNKDNIEIACLNCNLHRRTMHHERYLFTKNLNIVKITGNLRFPCTNPP